MQSFTHNYVGFCIVLSNSSNSDDGNDGNDVVANNANAILVLMVTVIAANSHYSHDDNDGEFSSSKKPCLRCLLSPDPSASTTTPFAISTGFPKRKLRLFYGRHDINDNRTEDNDL